MGARPKGVYNKQEQAFINALANKPKYNPSTGTTKVKGAGGGGGGKKGYPKLTSLLGQAYESDPRATVLGKFNEMFPQGHNMRDDFLKQNPNLLNFMKSKRNVPQNIKGLMQYLKSQGYNRADATAALRQYLKQDIGLAGYMPKKYVAPNKTDLLNAALTGIDQQVASGQDAASQDMAVQYAEAIRGQRLQQADIYQQEMYDKVNRIKDPYEREVAAQAIDQYANTMRMSANFEAENAFGLTGGKYSVADILGRANQGQNALINKLYSPSYDGTTGGGSDFSSMVLGNEFGG